MPQNQCELCSSNTDLSTYDVARPSGLPYEGAVRMCQTCRQQVEAKVPLNANHWHALRDSIWSENPAVKVLAWRILGKFPAEGWAQDLREQMYMEEDLLSWARAEAPAQETAAAAAQTRDSNGALLADGDSVTLIKDLEVKGAGFTAKRGTLVKNISLTDDEGLIEGRVNGTLIVLKTCFLKKA